MATAMRPLTITVDAHVGPGAKSIDRTHHRWAPVVAETTGRGGR